MIAVVDYGVGNLRSAQKGIERAVAEEGLDLEVRVTPEASDVENAEAVVLPGVGAFAHCMASLAEAGLTGAVLDAAGSGRPFFGICVGMQILFEESEEFGRVAGLGILPGKVVKFRSTDVKIPHMGWNGLRKRTPNAMLDGIDDGTYYYFVHSYCAEPAEPELLAATTTYGNEEFASAVSRDNVFATQFHPEKSQGVGIQLLRNFVRTVGVS
ncbi:MAG: imidazole glycerol phosphate synthase subunit HisH [Candidatus Binatia bacterium]|nr:imidazole glycerol phosphate synthase subunit HisH [Candidatus Binatia bacterium]